MKALKLKVFLAISTIILCAITIDQTISNAQTTASTTTTTTTPDKYELNYQAVQSDISNVRMQNEKIAYLEKKLKSDKKAGYDKSVIVDKNNLAKAKADLKRDKMYLSADKKNLVREYDLAIKIQKLEMKKDKSDLSASRKKLDHDLTKGNEEAAQKDALAVVHYQNEIQKDKNFIHNKRTQLNNELVALNKEIGKANGQFTGSLYAQNTTARVENWMNK